MKIVSIAIALLFVLVSSSCSKDGDDLYAPSQNMIDLRNGYVPNGFVWSFSDLEIDESDYVNLLAALEMRSTAKECVYLDMPNLKSIPDGAYEGADSYFILDAPSVESVGKAAFKDTNIYALLSSGSSSDLALKYTLDILNLKDGKSLPKVILGSLDIIGEEAFSDCDNLIAASTSASEIGAEAFSESEDLSYLDLVNVASIGDEAFKDCVLLGGEYGVTTATISGRDLDLTTATYVGSLAFDDTQFDRVVVGSLDNIVGDAFAGSVITELYVGEMGSVMLNDEFGVICKEDTLKSILDSEIPYDGVVTLDDKVTKIGERAVANCINIKEIDGEKVTSIKAGAFDGAINMEIVKLGGVTTIGAEAFKGCESLESLSIATGEGVKIEAIDRSAFEDVDLEVVELTVGASNAALVTGGNTLTIGENTFTFKSINVL